LVDFPNPCLCYYENKVWKIVPLNEVIHTTVKFTQLKVTLHDEDLRLVIGTKSHGLYYLSQGKWECFSSDHKLGSDQIHGLDFYQGKLYVAPEKGLAIITPEKVDLQWKKDLFKKTFLSALRRTCGCYRTPRFLSTRRDKMGAICFFG